MSIFEKFTKKFKKESKTTKLKETQAQKKVSLVEPVEKAATPAKSAKVGATVIVRPLVSEKSAIAESNNVYSFVVKRKANKKNVSQAVFALYGARPQAVNIINVKGKAVRFGGRRGVRSDWKKALVTMPKGKKISLHEGV